MQIKPHNGETIGGQQFIENLILILEGLVKKLSLLAYRKVSGLETLKPKFNL